MLSESKVNPSPVYTPALCGFWFGLVLLCFGPLASASEAPAICPPGMPSLHLRPKPPGDAPRPRVVVSKVERREISSRKNAYGRSSSLFNASSRSSTNPSSHKIIAYSLRKTLIPATNSVLQGVSLFNTQGGNKYNRAGDAGRCCGTNFGYQGQTQTFRSFQSKPGTQGDRGLGDLSDNHAVASSRGNVSARYKTTAVEEAVSRWDQGSLSDKVGYFESLINQDPPYPTSQVTSPAVCQSVQTAFRIHYKCEFGYHVDLSKKVPLAWCEGDMWSTTLALDLGATLEYKYVVCDSSGRAVRWQASDNLSLQLPTNAPVLDVCDSWDATVQSVLRPCPTPTDAGSQGVDSANLLNRGTASNVSNEGDSPTGSGTASIFSHELDTLRGFSSNPHLSDPHLSNPSSDFASRSLDGFLVNPLFEVAPDVPLFSQERELTSQVSISWWVPYHVQPGECLAVVGACPELGGWDPWRAVCLTWSEGDIWKGQTTIGGVEGGIESLEYKFVVLNRSGQVVRWYPARNSVVDFQPLQAEPAPRSQEPALGIPAQSPEQSPERSSYTS
eukprot:gene2772-12649_t